MIGGGYWATGITVRYGYAGSGEYGWSATADYYDDGFADDDADAGRVSTQGTLRTRYTLRYGRAGADALTVAIDTVKADAERLGIEWRNPIMYYERDGQDEDCPPPPGWREMVDAQAARLGWHGIYAGTGGRE